MIQIRRDLHKHPELGWQETRTAEKIESALEHLGLEPRVGAQHLRPHEGGAQGLDEDLLLLVAPLAEEVALRGRRAQGVVQGDDAPGRRVCRVDAQ